MMHGTSRLAVQERAHRKPVERPVRFPVQYRKEPDGIPGCKFFRLVPARYEIRPELVQAQAGRNRWYRHLCREHPYHTGKRFRKKGTSHTGILQRPALTESCRTQAYRQASEHGTGSQPRQMGGIFHEMAYRCGSQRHERHGMSEPYLFGADRGQAGAVQIVVAGQPLPDTA